MGVKETCSVPLFRVVVSFEDLEDVNESPEDRTFGLKTLLERFSLRFSVAQPPTGPLCHYQCVVRGVGLPLLTYDRDSRTKNVFVVINFFLIVSVVTRCVTNPTYDLYQSS